MGHQILSSNSYCKKNLFKKPKYTFMIKHFKIKLKCYKISFFSFTKQSLKHKRLNLMLNISFFFLELFSDTILVNYLFSRFFRFSRCSISTSCNASTIALDKEGLNEIVIRQHKSIKSL